MKVLWGYPGWGWQMFGLIGKENKWFFGLSRKEFLPKETEQQRRNRLEEVLSIHKAFTDAAERKSELTARLFAQVSSTAGLCLAQLRRKETEMVNLKKHLDLLGMRVEDRVTGFKGVVATVGFDLYGCIQAVVNPGADADGKLRDSQWFDVNRLRVVSEEPVMARPEFEWTPQVIAEAGKGPAERPAYCKA